MRLHAKTVVMASLLSLICMGSSDAGDLVFPPGQPQMSSAEWLTRHPPPAHYWLLELIMEDSSIGKWQFATKEACEAAISKYEKEQHGYNGVCTEHRLPATPAYANPATPGPATPAPATAGPTK